MSAERVLVTGAAGNLGRRLVQTLHRRYDVVAVDRRPIGGLPKDVTALRADIRWRGVEQCFRERPVQAIVHMGLMHNPRNEVGQYRYNVIGTQRLLELAAKAQVKKLVVLSSANIYGPDPDNSQYLDEDAPLLGAEYHVEIRDLVAVDRIVQSFFYRHPEVSTVMLRPVHIVGPRIRNAPSTYLRLRKPMTLMGYDPMVQLIHVDDIVHAIQLSLERPVSGVFNVVGPGEAPLSKVLELLGRRPRPVPSPLAWRVLSTGWRVGLLGFPPPELRHVQFSCVVDGQAARTKLGFSPRRSMEETVLSVLG
ncbi:MAG: NAD-dependent epimerase/dehydratase family protein [Myxococcota bacterium]